MGKLYIHFSIVSVLCFFSTFSSTTLNAAHLVGGDLSYECLGSNTYAVNLRMYRDCAGGGAAFDPIVVVAAYDDQNNLISTLNISLGSIRDISNSLISDTCVSAPPEICIEVTEYRDTVVLPPRPGGYTLVHQRCCRNSNVTNVRNSEFFGSTYSVDIPDQDTTCNSSPLIDNNLTLVGCVNIESKIQVRATDPDGDSLSYSLCRVYEGGGRVGGSSCNSVIPNPPCPPPFNPISFIAPQTFQSPIPGNPGYSIDPVTGLLTGTPTQMGNYAIGICVSEWRDGKRLSKVRLDFQMAVASCQKNVRSIIETPQDNPQMLCNGFTVDFRSLSVNASSLRWDFGDTSAVSIDTAETPSYTFPRPGRYKVSLVVNPGIACTDSSHIFIDVEAPVEPEIFWDGTLCFNAHDVNFFAMGNIPSDSRYEWQFGGDALEPVGRGDFRGGVRWASPGTKPVELRVMWDSCVQTVRDTIDIAQYSVPVDAGPDTTISRDGVVELQASNAFSHYWFADRPVRFNDRFSRGVRADIRHNEDTTVFYVQVRDENGCEGLDSLTVVVQDENESNYNMISPNGDGYNDEFDLSRVNPAGSCRLVILNRWGAEVFTDDQYQNDWSGVDDSGKPLSDGTYYFVLQCANEVRATGPVTIVRGG